MKKFESHRTGNECTRERLNDRKGGNFRCALTGTYRCGKAGGWLTRRGHPMSSVRVTFGLLWLVPSWKLGQLLVRLAFIDQILALSISFFSWPFSIPSIHNHRHGHKNPTWSITLFHLFGNSSWLESNCVIQAGSII